MKQTQVAIKFGMDPTALNKALNGKYSAIPVHTAIKLSKILDMSVEEIVASRPAELKRRYFELYEF